MKLLFIAFTLLSIVLIGNCQSSSTTPSDADVFLDIPKLSVGLITLEVDKVKADVSLDANIINLVQLNAGVKASIDRVNITIQNVSASAQLTVRLDNVKELVTETLDMLSNNTGLVTALLNTVTNTLENVAEVVTGVVDGVVDSVVNGVVTPIVNQVVTGVVGELTDTGNTGAGDL